MNSCQDYLKELEKLINEGPKCTSYEAINTLFLNSIATSLAVIADKMCEEDERNE